MAAYIILTNSNSSLSKRFRVIQEGYDDGTYNRAENVQFALGGGIDHCLGTVYRTWSPIIRVRHLESDSNYGDLEDLETFYKYNNPSGTPSTAITLTDHHGNSVIVHMVGQMMKQCMGCQIEGSEAWFLYKLGLIEVTV